METKKNCETFSNNNRKTKTVQLLTPGEPFNLALENIISNLVLCSQATDCVSMDILGDFAFVKRYNLLLLRVCDAKQV